MKPKSAAEMLHYSLKRETDVWKNFNVKTRKTLKGCENLDNRFDEKSCLFHQVSTHKSIKACTRKLPNKKSFFFAN